MKLFTQILIGLMAVPEYKGRPEPGQVVQIRSAYLKTERKTPFCFNPLVSSVYFGLECGVGL
jgi:hypothetical protein